MTEPNRKPAAGEPRDRLPKASHPSDSTVRNQAASATVLPLARRRITAARRASWRLSELIRLALWRRTHGVVVDADTFSFALAATLASAPASVSSIGRGGRAARWHGLDILSLSKACQQAALGHISDDELGTKIKAVMRWQNANPGKALRPDKLAQMLGLLAIERSECNIRTIGAVDESRSVRRERQKQAKRKAEAERLRAKRVGKHLPRTVYLQRATETLKPWDQAGVSRATWFRRKSELQKLFLPGVDVRSPAVTRYLARRAGDFRQLRNLMLMAARCSQATAPIALAALAEWSGRKVQTIAFMRTVAACEPAAIVFLPKASNLPAAIVDEITAATAGVARELRLQAQAIAQRLAA
jgi:hypothetical protein